MRDLGVFPFVALAIVVTAWLRRPTERRALVVRLGVYAVGIAALLFGTTRALGAAPPPGRLLVVTLLQLSLIVCVIAAANASTAALQRALAKLPRAWATAIATIGGQAGVFVLALPVLLLSLGLRRANGDAGVPEYALGRPFRPTVFRGHGGTLLHGGWIHAAERRGAVLLVHGLAADGAMFLPALEPLAERGFDVFTFDQRGHGASGGFTSTLGAVERHDVRAAWAEVLATTRGESIPRLAVEISLGGAALQLAAPDLAALDGMLLDSTFARASAPAMRHLPLPGPLAGWAFQLARVAAIPLLGHAVLDVTPIDVARANRGRYPITIVHARGDGLVPYDEARALKDAYGPVRGCSRWKRRPIPRRSPRRGCTRPRSRTWWGGRGGRRLGVVFGAWPPGGRQDRRGCAS